MDTHTWRHGLDECWRSSCNEQRARVENEAERAIFHFTSFWYAFVAAFCWIPSWRREFFAAHEPMREAIAEVVHAHAPIILDSLRDWQHGFEQWERENKAEGMGSEEATDLEVTGKDAVAREYAQMVEAIRNIPGVSWHFCGFVNPATMVHVPYPGFLSTQAAVKYTCALMEEFK